MAISEEIGYMVYRQAPNDTPPFRLLGFATLAEASEYADALRTIDKARQPSGWHSSFYVQKEFVHPIVYRAGSKET